MLKTLFDIDRIKYGTDEGTFTRAVALYEKGKVTQIECAAWCFSAVVLGTEPYRVTISARSFTKGHCTCYVGQKGIVCKHMVALAIHAVLTGKPVDEKTKRPGRRAQYEGRKEPLSADELAVVKAEISNAMKYIKAYRGPSRIWFAYQGSLSGGCAKLSEIVSGFPVNKNSADLLVRLLLRLDKKLCTGGVDDSDGTVGGFMTSVVEMLERFAEIDSTCIESFTPLVGIESCFGWEAPLVRLTEGKA